MSLLAFISIKKLASLKLKEKASGADGVRAI